MSECLRSIYRFEVGRLTDSGLGASDLHEEKKIRRKNRLNRAASLLVLNTIRNL